jgi:hypothetical protein
MKMGDFSPVLGPIKLVNSNPPEAPKLKSVLPILENRILGTAPQIGFEINAYPEVHKIGKINLYRTANRINAESVQSMDLIKVIDIETTYLPNDAIWAFTDDFNDLPEVPYSDGLFYRVTVSRKVEYANSNGDVIVEYAPSQPSKILVTTIVEAYKPESPVLEYYSEPQESPSVDLNYITLHWHDNVYKGNYRLYKLNSQGNWVEIARVLSDRVDKSKFHLFNTQNPTLTESWTEYGIIESINNVIYLQLEVTNLNSHNLTVLSADGSKLYHHFKVIAENTAGMFSVEEKILTLYNEVTWADIGGIAVPDRTQGMIIGPTFRVR